MKRTNWTKATTNPYLAIAGLISCMQAHANCWIEMQKNGEQEFPIKCVNPALNNPFNWKQAFGAPAGTYEQITFLNKTERDLYENWTYCYGSAKAVQAYRERGEVTKELFNGSGIGCPVRIKDANAYRAKTDGYRYGFWKTHWEPERGIPYHIADPDVGNVYVICYDDDPAEPMEQTLRSAQTLLNAAEQLLDIAGVGQAATIEERLQLCERTLKN